MIYDCFTFFNELELLEVRLHELSGVVDKFVLVEATQTFTGRPKPLHYAENRGRFSRFHEQIIHVIVDDLPQSDDPWVVEHFQRNCISRGLSQCRPDDWIMVSDVDEIPRAETVKKISREYSFPRGFGADFILRPAIRLLSAWKFSRGRTRRNHPFIWKFQQSKHCYFINCVTVNPPMLVNWYGTRILFYQDFSSAEEVRHSGRKVIENGGWHFTSMGGSNRIVEKIQSFSHQEFNRPEFVNRERLNEAINQGKPIFDPGEKLQFTPLDDSYPRYILEKAKSFSDWIKPIETNHVVNRQACSST
jgi:hypothetical protein